MTKEVRTGLSSGDSLGTGTTGGVSSTYYDFASSTPTINARVNGRGASACSNDDLVIDSGSARLISPRQNNIWYETVDAAVNVEGQGFGIRVDMDGLHAHNGIDPGGNGDGLIGVYDSTTDLFVGIGSTCDSDHGASNDGAFIRVRVMDMNGGGVPTTLLTSPYYEAPFSAQTYTVIWNRTTEQIELYEDGVLKSSADASGETFPASPAWDAFLWGGTGGTTGTAVCDRYTRTTTTRIGATNNVGVSALPA